MTAPFPSVYTLRNSVVMDTLHSYMVEYKKLACQAVFVFLTKKFCLQNLNVEQKLQQVLKKSQFRMSSFTSTLYLLEEGFIQKARQTVVVSVWGSRSYAALGIFVLNVYSIVHAAVVLFPLLLWGGMLYVDLYFKFKDRYNYFIYYLHLLE